MLSLEEIRSVSMAPHTGPSPLPRALFFYHNLDDGGGATTPLEHLHPKGLPQQVK